MEDKPGVPKSRSPFQARATKIRAEMEEITKRTQDALERSRAIIEKSKTNPGRPKTESDDAEHRSSDEASIAVGSPRARKG